MERSLEQVVDDTTAIERDTFATIKQMRSLSVDLSHGIPTPAAYIELMRFARDLLNWVGESADMPEWTTELKNIKAEVVGQMLMEHLPIDGTGFTVGLKSYWMAVGEHMGPDWIDQFRKVGAFMAKTESFR